MRARPFLALAALLALVSACGPKQVALPPAGGTQYPEFVRPVAPPALASSPAAAPTARAWEFLQASDLRSAEREVAAALRLQPGFYPASTTAAYVALARSDASGAAAQFHRVTEANSTYAPALAGEGLALAAANRPAEAARTLRAAVKADPSLTELSRRIEVLTLRGLQAELATATAAVRDGNLDAAARAYQGAIDASPESAFLYRELAGIEQQQGHTSEALEHVRRARALDPADAAAAVMHGDLLDLSGDLAGAVTAYNEALAIEFDPAVEAKRGAVRTRVDLAALPEQFKAIEHAGQVTRADLAALVGVRLPGLLASAPTQDIGVLTDIRGQWAERWMSATARTGVLESFPNHTFQPRTLVRRVDLAQAAARLLALVASADPTRGRMWVGAQGRFSDIAAGHLAYAAASVAVAAGVLEVGPDAAFQPTRGVTGAEAVAAIERIRALATPTRAGGRR